MLIFLTVRNSSTSLHRDLSVDNSLITVPGECLRAAMGRGRAVALGHIYDDILQNKLTRYSFDNTLLWEVEEAMKE